MLITYIVSMFKIKRLYRFMLQSFLPLFAMTFFICLFIVLMQFLWRYIDDLVGKGLEVTVIAELFFYAALTMVPMALPLAILLASLMTFGNLGERLELTAMKAAGVSLFKSMRPLIVLMVFVAIGAFFFQNNVLPYAQTKMWTLLYSMRQKSPEMEISEGAFNDQIPGFNIYAEKKDRETGMLYGMMVYDVSRGFENSRVIMADSGKLAFTADKNHMFVTFYHGEQFENLKEQNIGMSISNDMPYRKESFDLKEVLVAFDANFNRMDEEQMRKQYVGKNIAELEIAIDSIQVKVDSIGGSYASSIKQTPYFGIPYTTRRYENGDWVDVPQREITLVNPLNIDSLFNGASSSVAKSYINQALMKAKRQYQEYEFRSEALKEQRKALRRHEIELQKKFTLSFACIIFFFIGAPLGAIIKKGGIGTPLVISVILFIIYYIIDNTGYKMARDGRLDVIAGMWLSSAVLLPLGIFFTYKAVHDSAVFNVDAYRNFFRKLFGVTVTRHVEFKEVAMDDVIVEDATVMINGLSGDCASFLNRYKTTQNYFIYWMRGYERRRIRALAAEIDNVVVYMSNSRDMLLVAKLSQYPILRSLWLYRPIKLPILGLFVSVAMSPIALPLYFMGIKSQKRLKNEIAATLKINTAIIELLNSSETEKI